MIKKTIKYLIGLTIILFIFWTRFLRNRTTPSTLVFDHLLFEYLKICVIIILILYFLFSFIKGVKKALHITKQNVISKYLSNNTSVITLQNVIYSYIIDAPNYLYIKITENIKPFIEQPASYFTVYLHYPRTLVILLLLVPRIIVSTMFCFCLLYMKTMSYFYYSLNLLIPLLLFTIFVYIVNQFSERYLNTIETFIIFEQVYNPEGYLLKRIPKENYTDTEYTYEQYIKQFPVYCDLWQIYTNIYNGIAEIRFEKDMMSPYVQCYTSLCYFIGWFYIGFTLFF